MREQDNQVCNERSKSGITDYMVMITLIMLDSHSKHVKVKIKKVCTTHCHRSFVVVVQSYPVDDGQTRALEFQEGRPSC